MPDASAAPTRAKPPAAPSDEDTAFDHPVHLVVSAAGVAAPATCAPRSVFELATVDLLKIIRSSRPAPMPTAGALPIWERTRFRVTRDADITRRVVVPYQDTDEWRQHEAARRARQKPPRPPRGAKTMGKKLAELIGTDAG